MGENAPNGNTGNSVFIRLSTLTQLFVRVVICYKAAGIINLK